MAKTVGPLHSDDARGQLAKALVFLGWRGIKTVRGYIKPKYTNTTGQAAQRLIFSNAVVDYHTLLGGDVAGWVARQLGLTLSGFNRYMQKFIDTVLDGKTWNTIKSVAAAPAGTTATITATADVSAPIGDAIAYIGTTKGSWIMSFANAGAGTAISIAATGLSPLTVYWYMIVVTTTATPGETGYHTFTTTA